MTSYIEVESVYGTREVSLVTRHLTNRRLFITGKIDSDLANRILSEFLYLSENDYEAVDIYINSPGGEVNAGLMIYDILQDARMPINMICTGIAASMAAIILAGGQEGRRYIFPHSRVMIHEPLILGEIGGTASSIKNISESMIETRDICNGILAKHTNKTVKEIDKSITLDNYLNAEEAVKFGICDEIVSGIFQLKNYINRCDDESTN